MDQEFKTVKKFMSLSKLEFNLFKTLIQLEQNFNLENAHILMNLQISGGKDSMCLLNAFVQLFSSKNCKLKNKYTLIAQHFNHKQRGNESEEDVFFVASECIKKGIPIYIHNLKENIIKNNFQNYARSWRKQEAKLLSSHLTQQLNCTKYFIVTAHHARDHVESILLHILRGSGLSGLRGIPLFDEDKIFFRPFCAILYEELNSYCEKKNILFREDSSNLSDKYQRNYIRRNILPHFKHISKDFEKSFIKLSQNIENINLKYMNHSIFKINEFTTPSEVYLYLKQNLDSKNISQNAVKNLLHEAKLLMDKNNKEIEKELLLKKGIKVKLTKDGRKVGLFFVK